MGKHLFTTTQDTTATRYGGVGTGTMLGRRGFLGLSAAAALGAGGLLAGCGQLGSAAGPGNGSKKLGFALSTFTVPRYVKVDLPNFTNAASAQGYEVISQQADSNVDKQLENVTNLLSQNIAALCLMAVDAEAGVALVRKAKAANVPILAYNQAIPSKDLGGYVSRDNVQAGRDMVAAADKFLGGLNGNFIICSGQPGDQVAVDITQGYMEALKPALDSGKVKIVSQKFHAGWDPESARKQVEDSLTAAHNDVVAVLCNNDGLAGGAIQSLRAQGLATKAFVSGLDATSEACRAIVLGEQQMSVFTPYDQMGRRAAELSVKLAKGENIAEGKTYDLGGGQVPWFPMDSRIITKENVVEHVKQYSPAYVDAKVAFGNIPASQLPPGAAELVK
ncbi:substrate-binding domain-containing protein [Saccharopolyspora spinosa]|uniref:D-xylose transport system substrate-binding protein n=1 Tax=Saccharopolyspora spinosa TaxID=60894 RepID=A0A2N3Y6D8_SACSN|nr:substrate-binding domain-containing protein [Saccharopolyspora spinosa]PKW18494.1 D-xylose transport system substrate-binding protein [Saccharopolyspora spinosa]